MPNAKIVADFILNECVEKELLHPPLNEGPACFIHFKYSYSEEFDIKIPRVRTSSTKYTGRKVGASFRRAV